MRGFVTMLWRQAVIALPMALFFGTVAGRGPGSYLLAFWMALVFSYVIGLLLWALEHFVMPRLPDRPGESHTAAVLRVSAICTLTSIVGAALAAYIVHMTVMPGFLGSGRAVAVVGMYTLLFSALTTGIVLAVIFYRDAIQRVKAEQELELARRIQRAFLTSQFPAMPRSEVHAVNVSSRQVSGDLRPSSWRGSRSPRCGSTIRTRGTTTRSSGARTAPSTSSRRVDCCWASGRRSGSRRRRCSSLPATPCCSTPTASARRPTPTTHCSGRSG